MRGLVKSTVPCGIGILIPVVAVAGSRGVCQWYLYVVRGTVPGTCTPGSTFYVLRSTRVRSTFYMNVLRTVYTLGYKIQRTVYVHTQHEQTFNLFLFLNPGVCLHVYMCYGYLLLFLLLLP